MRNLFVFILFMLVIAASIMIGRFTGTTGAPPPAADTAEPRPVSRREDGAAADDRSIPSIGSIQVFNGCGTDNAGTAVADFLRSRGFDVKNVENAPTWNYPATTVVSRTSDMRNAERIAEALHTERVIMLRDEAGIYDVTVYIGADFREKIR